MALFFALAISFAADTSASDPGAESVSLPNGETVIVEDQPASIYSHECGAYADPESLFGFCDSWLFALGSVQSVVGFDWSGTFASEAEAVAYFDSWGATLRCSLKKLEPFTQSRDPRVREMAVFGRTQIQRLHESIAGGPTLVEKAASGDAVRIESSRLTTLVERYEQPASRLCQRTEGLKALLTVASGAEEEASPTIRLSLEERDRLLSNNIRGVCDMQLQREYRLKGDDPVYRALCEMGEWLRRAVPR